MKTVIGIVVVFTGFFVVIGLGSNYTMNSIDTGMHHGKKKKHGGFAQPDYYSGKKQRKTLFSHQQPKPDSKYPPKAVRRPGKMSTNPFAK